MAGMRPRGSIHGNRAVAGWLFVAPAIVIVGLFVLVPVVMAAWVSMSDWSGIGPPFAEGVNFVGFENYAELLGGSGLATRDLGTALRNNLFYVLLVVPLQTAVALGLAILVNRRIMRGRGFFRTAFYFPSVTSSVAIVVLWLFLFSATGPVNKVLSWIWIDGPELVPGPARRLPHRPGGLRRDRHGQPARSGDVPGDQRVGMDRRPVGRHVGVHPHGGVHHLGHVHAALHRRPPADQRRGRGGGA